MEENKNIPVDIAEDKNESLLVIRAKEGDKAAFGRLVKKHQQRVLRMVVAMTGDLDSAMDIVQDSFIRAYKALESFDSNRPFYPWISTIAVNLTYNYFKKSGREVSFDPEKDTRSDGADPLRQLRISENDKRFLKAVQELPEQYRIVFILRSFEHLSYNEIALKLKISEGTVDSRLYRARRILLDKLKDLLE
ncbi:MAG: sigma-70 family RNA polymerase sigma factor [candidate division Zixibacteria bacterium]|nr:sigma-70 family RNA polymerase sigma factor [candidate division Zixibacteria bacterium]